ncbi:MAG: hypothetical protein KAS58_05200, partial [Calditrichia bacterium]|nr:hypothetical protein [Calditrichia bacterium]
MTKLILNNSCIDKKFYNITRHIIIVLLLLILFSCTEERKPLLDADKKINLANTYYNNELYRAAIKEY